MDFPQLQKYFLESVKKNQINDTKYFVEKGVGVRYNGDEAMRIALRNGSQEMVKYLLSKGCGSPQ